MDNGNFYYPFALAFRTNDEDDKEIYLKSIKELSDDYACTDQVNGELSCMVCFHTSEKYYKFIRDTGITGYKVHNSPEQIKQRFHEIVDAHIKKQN